MDFAPIKMLFGLINVVQAQSYARDGIKFAGAALAAHGIGNATIWEAVAGLVVALVGTLWSQYAARQKSIVATAATIVPIPVSSQIAAGVDVPVIPQTITR